jgi:FixJ family two-component response regulator
MHDAPTVFVVDDDPSVRSALKRLVASVGLDCETFASADEYLAQLDPAAPGCLIVDMRLPGLSGLELQEHLGRRGYHPPIIFLTGYGDIKTTVRAMKGGAVDFLTKPFHEQELLDAVRQSVERDREGRLKHAERTRRRELYKSLTPRERQVLALVVTGHLNKQIAAELGLSESTVKLHRGEVMQKMEAHSVAELVSIVADIEIASPSAAPESA